MTVHSIFGASAPPGAYTVYSDGFPSIWLGQTFYRTTAAGPLTDSSMCVGAKIWTPVGTPPTVLVRAFVQTDNGSEGLAATPTREKLATVVPGGWTTATWDTPFLMPDADEPKRVLIGYQFRDTEGLTANNSDDYYVHTPGMRAGTAAIQSGTASNLYAAESNQGAFGPGTIIRIGTGSMIAPGNASVGYGIDILVDDLASANNAPTASAGPDQTVTVGSPVTLSAAGSSDPDGTIAAYAWEQTSGAAVALSGTGATRTFTPATSGARTFTVTVTDDDGASATDAVTVTVQDAPGETLSVSQENALDGTARGSWYNGIDAQEIPGFARKLQVEPGDDVEFSVDYDAGPYDVLIHRLGWYAETEGARLIDTFTGTPTAQPEPVVIPDSNGAVTCASWSVTDTWTVPADATPGWYYALLRNAGATDFGHILFCVGDSTAPRSILMVGSDPTWGAAYNSYGGKSVYGAALGVGAITDRSLCVSYDRPVITREHVPATHFFNGEYPVLRFLERFGFDVGYATQEAIEADPTILEGRYVVIFAGHNEYVSQTMWNAVEDLLSVGDAWVLNLSANDFFWRTRFGTTDDADVVTKGRVLWCRKDTMPGPGGHVAGTPFVTDDWQGTWQDTRRPGGPELWAERFGDMFIANGIRDDDVRVPAWAKNHPVWRDIPEIAALDEVEEHSFGAGTLGFEWDYPYPQYEGVLHRISSSGIVLDGFASDENGQSYTEDGYFVHSVTVTRPAASVIVNFNTAQWGWALDNFHLRGNPVASDGARQATLNVLADFGTPPQEDAVIAAGLVNPTPVEDFDVAYGFADEPEPADLVTRVRSVATRIGAEIKALRASFGQPSGIATLDSAGKVPVTQLPDGLGGGAAPPIFGVDEQGNAFADVPAFAAAYPPGENIGTIAFVGLQGEYNEHLVRMVAINLFNTPMWMMLAQDPNLIASRDEGGKHYRQEMLGNPIWSSWNDDYAYVGGDMVVYGGLYRWDGADAVGQEPGVSPDWTLLIPSGGGGAPEAALAYGQYPSLNDWENANPAENYVGKFFLVYAQDLGRSRLMASVDVGNGNGVYWFPIAEDFNYVTAALNNNSGPKADADGVPYIETIGVDL